jgi:putative peptide zinc metalloprotease protein
MTTGISPTQNMTTSAAPGCDSDVPQAAAGIQLLGEYQGAGFAERRFLVYRADGQAVLLSRLLYATLSRLDGRRSLRELAEQVSAEHQQSLGPDAIRYLVEHKLEPLGLAVLHRPPEKPPVADPLLALTVRGVLLPARVVRAVGRIFAPLHLPPVVVTILAALIAVDVWSFGSGHGDTVLRQTVANPQFLLVSVALLAASIIFHEFGHASGCHYGGARPGPIGIGVYVVFPCFYTNVTDAYRLNRAGRLRTDLGGIYFNAVLIVALSCAYLPTGYPPLLAAAVLGHLQILRQLLPTLRMDGYYIMADLIGVPNLFGLIRPTLRGLLPGNRHRRSTPPLTVNLRPATRRFVTVWVLATVTFLTVGITLMIARIPLYTTIAWYGSRQHWATAAQAVHHHHILTAALSAASILTIWLPWLGMVVLAIRLLRRATKRLRGLLTRRHERPA